MATRTLNIYGYNLKQDVTLVLTFSPPESSRPFGDQYPVAWKVIKLTSGRHSKASATYVARHAFSLGQADKGNNVDAETWAEVQRGEVTTVVGSEDSKKILPATKGPKSNLASLKNETDDRIDVSFGFVNGDGIDQRYEPTLFWKGLGPATIVEVNFTPVLSAYVTRDFQETEIIRGEIESEAIWTQDLNSLPEVSGWNFLQNESGSFSLESASTP